MENSTRTKTSFDVAGKRLSADTYSLAKSGSSLNKGESLKDTALTLQAMGPDVIVIRHSSSGAAAFMADLLPCGVVNGGDGWHAHPTQALLDCFSLRQVWGDNFAGRTLLILGDIAHSQVARSNVRLLHLLGGQGPALRAAHPAARRGGNLAGGGLFRSQTRRARRGRGHVPASATGAPAGGPAARSGGILAAFLPGHGPAGAGAARGQGAAPRPLNRGLEISHEIADAPASLVLDQVAAGVATRMAVLYLLATRNDGGNA